MFENKTMSKLLDEVSNGCKDLDAIKNDAAIALALNFIDEHRQKSPMHICIKDFLNYKDMNLYDLKCRIAKSVIQENYDDLDILFDEAHSDYMQNLLEYKDYY